MSTVHATRNAVQHATIHARAPFSVISHGYEAELRSEHAAMQSMSAHVSSMQEERARWAAVLGAPAKRVAPRLVHGRISHEIQKARMQDFAFKAGALAIAIGSTVAILFIL